jgi:hypothetical protein
MSRFFIFSVLIILVFLASFSLAEIPKMINYQGMLTDNSGNPLSGPHNLTFRIYDDTTGGNLKWSETQNGVQVENGLFNVILGQVALLDLAFDEQYWLEVQVGDSDTMPRLRFTSVGYSYRAIVADSAAKAGPIGGGWNDDGSVVRLSTSTDYVGIGTAEPLSKLHLKGDDFAFLRFDAGRDTTWKIGITSDGSNDLVIHQGHPPSGLDRVRFMPNGDVHLTVNGGNVGIGTSANAFNRLLIAVSDTTTDLSTAAAALAIRNVGMATNNWALLSFVAMDLEGSPMYVGRIGAQITARGHNSITGDLVMHTVLAGTGTERMRITSAGNVGIGTTNPQGALDVSSTTGAFIVPRMTTTQRNALSAVNGMIIYNTTTNQFNFYENGAWVTK